MDHIGDLSHLLRERRLKAGLSLSQMAVRADTSTAALSRYENNWRRFEIYTLRKLAAALGYRMNIDFEPLPYRRDAVSTSIVINKIKRLFWDKTLNEECFNKHPLWVVKRVLEYGTLDDVLLLIRLMGKQLFLERVSLISFPSVKTEQFWSKMLNREGVTCTKKHSPKAAGSYWPA